MNRAAVASLLVRTNAFAAVRFLNRGKVPVVMYHRFSASEEYGKTSRQTLEAHLRYLTRYYKLISLSEVVARIRDAVKLPARTAVITVDDGYRDFYDIAFPLFKQFEVPATLYVVTDFVDGKCWIWTDIARFITARSEKNEMGLTIGDRSIIAKLDGLVSRLAAAGEVNSELKKLPDERKDEILKAFAASMGVTVPELPPPSYAPLDWEKVRVLKTGGIDIGSHTVSHPILTNVEDLRLATELQRSRVEIKDKLQIDEVHFCYPNGNVGGREVLEAEKAGYASAVTTEIRLCENNENKFMIPRIDAEPEMHRFVQATSGADKFKSPIR
jgi:peptidoglycan/xylan/chitin deacetylase (PgdA/CDA1 family)